MVVVVNFILKVGWFKSVVDVIVVEIDVEGLLCGLDGLEACLRCFELMMEVKGGIDGGICISFGDLFALVALEYIQTNLRIQGSSSRISNYLKPEIVHHE